MSRRCDLTGTGVMTGHRVSHANNKTKRVFRPNLCSVTLISEALGRAVKLDVTAATLRSVEHRGGLDAFLVKARPEQLTEKGRLLKREVETARAAEAPAAPLAG